MKLKQKRSRKGILFTDIQSCVKYIFCVLRKQQPCVDYRKKKKKGKQQETNFIWKQNYDGMLKSILDL